MPGFEVFGKEELAAIIDLFERNGGVLFAHGFEDTRCGIYKVREYETAFANWVGTAFAQAVSSGSAALKIALNALNVGRGDEVITQAFTFVATVEAILETGATPVIVDIDDSLNMHPASLAAAINTRTKAIIPVHMMGEPAQMDEIAAIAEANNVPIIEDAAQAFGASFRGKNVGTIGLLGAFSTDAYKTLNTGEGGVTVTSSKKLHAKVRSAHDHGHEYNPNLSRAAEKATGRGFNYRMTEIQAAIGLVQLSKARGIIDRQRKNKKSLLNRLGDLPIAIRRSPDLEGDAADAVVFLLPDRGRAAAFAGALLKNTLPVKTLPNALRWHFAKHWSHLFDVSESFLEGRWRKSADLLERAVAIPIKVSMEAEYIDQMAERIRNIAMETL